MVPNVSGNAPLDVLIGLFFVYFLLSIVCSSVNEGIAATFNLRAKDLERGIHNLLDGKTNSDKFFKHPRVRALFKPAHPIFKGRIFKERKPSYIPSRVFALTVLDTFAPRAGAADSRNLIERARDHVGTTPAGRVQDLLEEALDQASTDVDQFRAAIEESFNEVMDRVSGWYKRRVQLILFAIALVLVVGINADSYTIGQKLWKDDALRSAVVAQANKVVVAGQAPCVTSDSSKDATAQAAACVNEVKALGLPLGWTRATAPHNLADGLAKLIGLLVTAFALTLGAPFWFDLLGKVARLRASGPTTPGTNKQKPTAAVEG